jgi:hypothetical protein
MIAIVIEKIKVYNENVLSLALLKMVIQFLVLDKAVLDA